MGGSEKFVNGDVVLLRSVYRGRVRWTFPHAVVATEPLLALHVGPGTPGKLMKRAYGKRDYAEPWVRGDPPAGWIWEGGHVNLQAPLRPSRAGFDTTDWALDVRVDADGTWEFPTGWEDRRPDPAWTPPELPEDWHVVD